MSESDNSKQNLELFKIYIQSAENISDRRSSANTWMISVNSVIASFYSYLKTGESVISSNPEKSLWLSTLPIVGILICFAWLGLLESYKQLNNAKYSVIKESERNFQMSLYHREQVIYKSKLRKPLSNLEKKIPVSFIVLYIGLLFASLYNLYEAVN